MTIRYTITRRNPWLPRAAPVVSDFRVHVWGLGYSLVDLYVKPYGFHFRLFILPQIVDGETITLRIGLSMEGSNRAADIHPLLGWLPLRVLNPLVQSATLRGVEGEVRQDVAIWENKIYVDPPTLAKGDGPIGPYRKYCRQFYPALRAESAAAE